MDAHFQDIHMIIRIEADLVHIAKRTDGFDFSTLGNIDSCQREIEMGGDEYNKACPVIEIVPVVSVLVDGSLDYLFLFDGTELFRSEA